MVNYEYFLMIFLFERFKEIYFPNTCVRTIISSKIVISKLFLLDSNDIDELCKTINND